MAADFQFPRPKAATPRRAPVSKSGNSRQSNALRASVLDAALELGIGGDNSVVADWMFNNALKEEDEEDSTNPGLTYGSSEESSLSNLTTPSSPYASAPHSGPGVHFSPNIIVNGVTALNGMGKPPPPPQFIQKANPRVGNSSLDAHAQAIENGLAFPDPAPPRSTTPLNSKKLKKKKGSSSGDGYESDGGFVGDSAIKQKKDKKEKDEVKERDDEDRKRKKSLVDAVRPKKKDKGKEEGAVAGYESDGAAISSKKKTKSKSKAKEGSTAGDETDGYQSSGGAVKKSKSRFFKLSGKSSRTDLAAANQADAVPALPPMPLPIAEKFGTTLHSGSISSVESPVTSPAPSSASTVRSLASPSAALPPLSFSSFGEAAADSTAPPIRSTVPSAEQPNRDSQVSTGSSSASNTSKRQMGFFSPLSPQASRDSGNEVYTGNAFGHAPVTPVQQNHSQTPSSSSSAGLKSLISFPLGRGPPLSSSSSYTSPSQSTELPQSYVSTAPLSTNNSPPSSSGSVPPVVPVNMSGRTIRARPSLEQLNVARYNGLSTTTPSVSPGPLTPNSPYVVVTPQRSPLPSPSLVESGSGLPGVGGIPVSPRPRHPPTEGFGPKPTSGLAQAGTVQSLAPHTFISGPFPQRPASPGLPRGGKIGGLTVRPPSPNTNIPSVVHMPPPSPEPMTPLPTLPPHQQQEDTQPKKVHFDGGSPPGSSTQFPSPAQLRQRVMDRTPRTLPPDSVVRGKESPFPARPLNISAPIQSMSPPGLGARRYKGMFSPPAVETYDQTPIGVIPPTPTQQSEFPNRERDTVERIERERQEAERAELGSALRMRRMGVANGVGNAEIELGSRTSRRTSWIALDEDGNLRRARTGMVSAPVSVSISGDDDFSDGYRGHDDEEEMNDVLDRFEDRSEESAESHYSESALSRNHSIQAHRQPSPSPSPSARPVAAQRFMSPPASMLSASNPNSDAASTAGLTEYAFELDDGATLGDRTSRWTESVYSRSSILDEDESGTTRHRFLKRVEAMLNEDKTGRDYIPPVPRIPDAYATEKSAGRTWNKF